LAEHDRIIDNGRTRAYVEGFASSDKQIIEYPGGHHTLEFEPNPDLFINDLIDWLRHRFPAKEIGAAKVDSEPRA
jgi:alpha-beta hydrolase superfamily lysophospholipase